MNHDLTDAQRRYQSMTEYERMAYSAANAERIQRYQKQTIDAGPENQLLPWTHDEDNLLIWSPKRTVDLAIQLRRTYTQCNSRRALLRRNLTGEARHYIKAEDATIDESKTLCACATFDDDHESWCPNAR